MKPSSMLFFTLIALIAHAQTADLDPTTFQFTPAFDPSSKARTEHRAQTIRNYDITLSLKSQIDAPISGSLPPRIPPPQQNALSQNSQSKPSPPPLKPPGHPNSIPNIVPQILDYFNQPTNLTTNPTHGVLQNQKKPIVNNSSLQSGPEATALDQEQQKPLITVVGVICMVLTAVAIVGMCQLVSKRNREKRVLYTRRQQVSGTAEQIETPNIKRDKKQEPASDFIEMVEDGDVTQS